MLWISECEFRLDREIEEREEDAYRYQLLTIRWRIHQTCCRGRSRLRCSSLGSLKEFIKVNIGDEVERAIPSRWRIHLCSSLQHRGPRCWYPRYQIHQGHLRYHPGQPCCRSRRWCRYQLLSDIKLARRLFVNLLCLIIEVERLTVNKNEVVNWKVGAVLDADQSGSEAIISMMSFSRTNLTYPYSSTS